MRVWKRFSGGCTALRGRPRRRALPPDEPLLVATTIEPSASLSSPPPQASSSQDAASPLAASASSVCALRARGLRARRAGCLRRGGAGASAAAPSA